MSDLIPDITAVTVTHVSAHAIAGTFELGFDVVVRAGFPVSNSCHSLRNFRPGDFIIVELGASGVAKPDFGFH